MFVTMRALVFTLHNVENPMNCLRTLFFSFIALLSFAALANGTLPMAMGAPSIDAPAYVIMDYHTGTILAEKNADARREPASLTKMMTSYVLSSEIASGRVKAEDMATVSEKAWRLNKNPSENSLMFLEVNKQVSLHDLHLGIIIQSGNDASIVVAEHLAGSEEAFANMMNQYAKQLGMTGTHFKNSTGLPDPEHYSTARDMAILGAALIRDFPQDYAYYSQKEFSFNGITQANRNSLLWDKSFNVDGIKTGHTNGAGFCLVSSVEENGMRLISSVMGSKNMATRAQESKVLLTWAFRNFDAVQAVKAGDTLTTTRLWYGAKEQLSVGLASAANVVIPRGRRAELKANFSLLPELEAPMPKGQVVGKLFLQLDGKDIAEFPLVALEEVQEGGLFSRAADWVSKKFAD